MMKMLVPNGFVDCVSLFCPSIFTKTKLKLEEMKSGEKLEIICETKTQADRLVRDVWAMAHRVIQTTQDEAGSFHIVVEKTH